MNGQQWHEWLGQIHWQSAADFWAMGGYGVYVWGSMGVSVALLALEVLLTRWGRSQALDAVCDVMAMNRDDSFGEKR